MKQFLISFKTFHGVHVNERYPERVVRNHIKLVNASSEKEAIKKLTQHIKTIDSYNIDGWGMEKKEAIEYQKAKIAEALATIEFNNIY